MTSTGRSGASRLTLGVAAGSGAPLAEFLLPPLLPRRPLPVPIFCSVALCCCSCPASSGPLSSSGFPLAISAPPAEREATEGVPELEFLDLRIEDCAAAIGSPQEVLAKVGNPPSTGKKIPGGDVGSLSVGDEAPVDSERPLTLCQGVGAGSASGPSPGDLSLRVVEVVVVLALSAGASPLAEILVIPELAALGAFRTV